MVMRINNLNFSYGDKEIVKNIDMNINKGEFVGLIGPNGSGKSTVLKNLYKALKPDSGTVILDSENLLLIKNKELAKKVGILGQENVLPFDFKVKEIVAMGRNPHKKIFDIDTKEDKEIINHALEHLGMKDFADTNYLNLSGGEKQRVILARVIAQETDFLILDEPTNHLDIRCQLEMFDLIKRLKVTVLSAIHDLNIAALYCDRIYVIKNGEVFISGNPKEVLTPEVIYEVYGVNADVMVHPITNKLSITYLPKSLSY